AALKALGYDSESNLSVDLEGCPDAEVLAYAAQHRRVIVTKNTDLVLICCEAEHPVIWYRPKGRESFAVQVITFFTFGGEWESLLASADAVQQGKTNAHALTFAQVRQRVVRRMRRTQRERTARYRAERDGQQSLDDD
ncbi:MAG TPA: hypothetical protein DCS55_11400, partial [Acidimicrobiaceae bacterium]|nr:hypothetical protein [Acidimicrobiaceae bacterium]